jgi:hypothetical protein
MIVLMTSMILSSPLLESNHAALSLMFQLYCKNRNSSKHMWWQQCEGTGFYCWTELPSETGNPSTPVVFPPAQRTTQTQASKISFASIWHFNHLLEGCRRLLKHPRNQFQIARKFMKDLKDYQFSVLTWNYSSMQSNNSILKIIQHIYSNPNFIETHP